MQEVFEKIKKKVKDNAYIVTQRNNSKELGMTVPGIMQAIDEIAEEYNNGWIPVSERLPEEHKLYDITFENDAGIHSDSAIYEPFSGNWYWDDDETEITEGNVLAWTEKREPYQPKGE